MKLIVESWRKGFLLEKVDLPDPKTFSHRANPTTGEVIPRMPADKPPSAGSPIEKISVKEFLDFYSGIETKVEYYDKMDDEINELLEYHIGEKISGKNRQRLVKLIGKSIRAYVGQVTGEGVDKIVNGIIKAVLKTVMTMLDVGELRQAGVLKVQEWLGQWIIKPIVGQYLAEYAEEKIKGLVGKFDPDELGDVKNDAGRAFSVSAPVKKLITSLQDDFEEKLSSEHLKKLSHQLKQISILIKRNQPPLYTGDIVAGIDDDKFLDTPVEFLQTSIVNLKGYERVKAVTGDEIALQIVAKHLGAKKVEISESQRRSRIIYRGKQ